MSPVSTQPSQKVPLNLFVMDEKSVMQGRISWHGPSHLHYPQTCNYWVLAVRKCKASPSPTTPLHSQAEWATAENEDTLLRTAWQPAASSFVAIETSYLWLCQESILKRSTASCEHTSLAWFVAKTRDIMAGELRYWPVSKHNLALSLAGKSL